MTNKNINQLNSSVTGLNNDKNPTLAFVSIYESFKKGCHKNGGNIQDCLYCYAALKLLYHRAVIFLKEKIYKETFALLKIFQLSKMQAALL